MALIKKFSIALFLSLTLSLTAHGHVSEPILPIPQSSFSPVVIDSIEDFSDSAPNYSKPEIPKVISDKKTVTLTVDSISGYSSWYCSASKPICHYKYPVGSMVAAAGPALRKALGGGEKWRNQIVTVSVGKKEVKVKLVDWCQCYKNKSNEKIIDLYNKPFTKLSPNGERVTISW